MILSALYELAQRKHLVDDPDYEKKKVDFFLAIDENGSFRGLIPTRTENNVAATIDVPRFPKRSSGISAGFLFDNSKYVLGLGGDDTERNERCVEAFVALVTDLVQKTQDEGAIALARFFERRKEQLPAIVAEHPDGAFTGSEWIAFRLEGDGERNLHERPAIRSHWASLRQTPDEGESGPLIRCLVTGDVGLPARTHGNIKRVPDAQTAGAALVSFNAEAFLSHGLKQGENAPVSRAAAEGYVTALNYLLEGGPKRRFRQGIALGENSALVFWTRDENAFVEDFLTLMDPSLDAEEVHELVKSPWKGLEPAPIDETNFYAMTLGGNAARVVLRDWISVPVKEAKANLKAYFEALRIEGDDGKPLPIRRLLEAVTAPSGRGLSPDLGTRLFHSALYGSPFPRELLSAALRRLRLPPHKLYERQQLVARCALIKATLMRNPIKEAQKEVTVSLNEQNTDLPYLLGRLFAALERLQGEAQGDINTTIRDKFFASASTNPSLVFSRLLKLSMHHASKAKANNHGRENWVEIVKSNIMNQISSFPKALDLEAQGLFAIGYYHQRQDFFKSRKPVATDLTKEPDAPNAEATEPSAAA